MTDPPPMPAPVSPLRPGDRTASAVTGSAVVEHADAARVAWSRAVAAVPDTVTSPAPVRGDVVTVAGEATSRWSPVPSGAAEPGTGTAAGVDRAVAALRSGRFAVVVGDEGRAGGAGAGGGSLVLAAQAMTTEAMAFMIRHTSGVICVALEGSRLDALQLPPMVTTSGRRTNGQGSASPGVASGGTGGPVHDPRHLAFTVSVDATAGTSTGTSAADRGQTVHTLIDPGTRPDDLRRPGHVFPVRYHDGGVLRQAGPAEAAVDLTRLAGLHPAAVLAELVGDDGSTPRRDDVARFAARHGLPVLAVADLVRHRQRTEKLVRRGSAARLPTRYGDFTAVVFASVLDGTEHLALVRGEVAGRDDVLAHVHLECPTGDTFGSFLCRCGRQLDAALTRIARAEAGVLVYVRRGEGWSGQRRHPLRLCLRPEGAHPNDAGPGPDDDPVADGAPHDLGAQILADLQVTALRLLTDDPAAVQAVGSHGLDVAARVPLTAERDPA